MNRKMQEKRGLGDRAGPQNEETASPTWIVIFYPPLRKGCHPCAVNRSSVFQKFVTWSLSTLTASQGSTAKSSCIHRKKWDLRRNLLCKLVVAKIRRNRAGMLLSQCSPLTEESLGLMSQQVKQVSWPLPVILAIKKWRQKTGRLRSALATKRGQGQPGVHETLCQKRKLKQVWSWCNGRALVLNQKSWRVVKSQESHSLIPSPTSFSKILHDLVGEWRGLF